jgi:hypothetical protein
VVQLKLKLKALLFGLFENEIKLTLPILSEAMQLE